MVGFDWPLVLLDISRDRPVPRGPGDFWFPLTLTLVALPFVQKWREASQAESCLKVRPQRWGEGLMQESFDLRGTNVMINPSTLGVFKTPVGVTLFTQITLAQHALSLDWSVNQSLRSKKKTFGSGSHGGTSQPERPTGRWWTWPVHSQRFAPAFCAAN